MFSVPRVSLKSAIFSLLAMVGVLSAMSAPLLASNTGVAPVLVPYTITAIAGNTQTSVGGFAGDGVPALSATLNGPNALAVDSVGNVYIADQSNALIREINAQTGIIKVIAGVPPSNCTGTVCTTTNPGCADGVPASGSPVGSRVQGLVVDGFGNLYFSDYNYQGAWVIYRGGAQVESFIRTVDASGVSTAGGVKPGYVYHIAGLATPKAGGGCSPTTGAVDQVLATQASFHDPLQMGIDAAGNIYMQDYANSVVRVINTQATSQVFFGVTVKPGFIAAVVGCNRTMTTVCPASPPAFGGLAGAALFSNQLAGMTTDQFGNIYELDTAKATGGIYAGVAYAGGNALAHLINIESGLTATAGGWYEVINSYTGPNSIVPALPVGAPPALAALANNVNNLVLRPTSIAVDPAGNLYFMDYHWITVYRIDVNSQVATRLNTGLGGPAVVAGSNAVPAFCSGTSGPQTTDNYGDGCPFSQSKFNSGGAGYVTFDGAGNLYVSDTGNNIVRKVSLGTRFPATAIGASLTQTLQLHFDASNLPASATSFKIVSSAADFTINGTPTCANIAPTAPAPAVDASQDCYVSVTFNPAQPGARSATLQATTANNSVYPFPLSGFGSGSQIAIDGGTPAVLPASGLGKSAAVATDARGNVYIADATNNRVVLMPAGGAAQTTIDLSSLTNPASIANPQGVAVDAQSNLYISDSGNNRIVKVSATTGTASVLTSSVNNPHGLAIDAAGNLYVADTGNARIVEIPAFGELAPSPLLAYVGAPALVSPVAVAIDKAGNVYVADSSNPNGLIRLAPGGGDLQPAPGGSMLPPATTLIGFGAASVGSPSGVAIDAAGDLYVSDSKNNTVVEVPAATGPGSEPFNLNLPGLNAPAGIALDTTGNLYVADSGNSRVLLDNRSNLALDFGNVYLYQAPGALPLTVTNIGSTPYTPTSPFATFSGTNAAEYSETDTCAASNFPLGTLTAGLHCSLTPTFTPAAVGIRTASASVENGVATIALTGTGFLPQPVLTLTAAAPGGLVADQTATITLTASQPLGVKNIPAGGQVTFTYSVNGVVTTLAPAVLPPSGTLSMDLPKLLLGRRYVVNASYSGDALDSASTAPALAFYVPGLPLTVTAASLSYLYGSKVPQPVGTVSGILPADQASVTYTFSTTATPSSPVGSYPVSINFSGGNYQNYGFPPVLNADRKTPASVTEMQAPLTVAVTSATAPYGAANLTFTATLTGLVNGDQPTVTYMPAKSQLLDVGTYPIVPTVTDLQGSTYDRIKNYAVTLGNGTLTVTQANSALAVTQPLKAVLPASLSTAAITINAAPAIANTYGTPTGTLTLQDVFTPLTATGAGTTVTEPPITLNLAAGVATYTPTDPTLGTHVYTVTYAGDANFVASSTSLTPNTLVVDVADFTIVSTTSPIQIAPGVVPGGNAALTGQQAATPETASVTITPVLGSTQVVTLTCAVPASYLTCTLTPSSVTLTGTAAQISTIAISAPLTLPLNYKAQLRRSSRTFELAFIPLALLTILPLCFTRRRVIVTKLLVLLVGATFAIGLGGCGSNLVQFFTPVPTGPQQVTVTGTSGSISRSFTVNVNVQ